MRWNPTPAEAALWELLRGKRVGNLRFRRQHPLGPFVLDFCCPSVRLVVEVDGGIHLEAEQAVRDQALPRPSLLERRGAQSS
jgi:very-short-patch-repair endonuclease